jgi:hypothetical protein
MPGIWAPTEESVMRRSAVVALLALVPLSTSTPATTATSSGASPRLLTVTADGTVLFTDWPSLPAW